MASSAPDMAEDIEQHMLRRLFDRYRWSIFIVMVIAYFFVYFQRITVGVVGSDIVEEVGGTIGVLSSVYFWTYTAMQIPSGLLADRFGPRISCAVFLGIATIGSLLTAFGDTFEAIVIGKIMIAAGMAIVYVPLMKLISIWFPKQDFAVLNGIVIAVGNIGAISAAGPLSMLASAIGWRDVFLILGVITGILASLCLVIIRDHPSERGLPPVEVMFHGAVDRTERSADKVPVLKGLRAVFSGGRRFWTCALAYCFVYGTIMVYQGTWAVKYFDSVYGFALSASWMITSLGIGKILSTLMIGMLTTRGLIRSKRRTMLFGTVCFASVWAIIFLFSGRVDDYWFWFVISTLFGFFGGFMTLSFTQMKEWFPVSISGTAVSGMNVFLFLGASVCTTVSGMVIGKEYTLENFSTVWGMMFVLSILAVIMIFLSVEKGKDDEILHVR